MISTVEPKDELPDRADGLIDDQTIGEMADQDRDNFDYVMRTKTYLKRFPIVGGNRKAAYDKAMKYTGAALDAILRKHGVKIKPWMLKHPEKTMHRTKEEFGVHIETRKYPPDEEVYQTGIYVLKLRSRRRDMVDHEIVGFISEPFVWYDTSSPIIQLQTDVMIRATEKI